MIGMHAEPKTDRVRASEEGKQSARLDRATAVKR